MPGSKPTLPGGFKSASGGHKKPSATYKPHKISATQAINPSIYSSVSESVSIFSGVSFQAIAPFGTPLLI